MQRSWKIRKKCKSDLKSRTYIIFLQDSTPDNKLYQFKCIQRNLIRNGTYIIWLEIGRNLIRKGMNFDILKKWKTKILE